MSSVRMSTVPADLVAHLVRTTDLSPTEASRVVADVLAYYAETAADWVRRRHGELQRTGLTNDAIFQRISEELPDRRFQADGLSARQLRRIVYS